LDGHGHSSVQIACPAGLEVRREVHIGDGIDVCAGIIYPTAPKTAGLKARIEEYLNDRGMQVVWYDW
jgi:hypothetical protein